MAELTYIQGVTMKRQNEIQYIVDKFYEIISGEAGEERKWNEFRSLFLSGDSSIAPVKFNVGKECIIQRFDVESYIARLNNFLINNDFYEYGFNYEIKEIDSIAHVYSEYEAKRKKEDKEIIKRGINLVQLVHDGQAWKIHSMLWQDK